MDLSEAKGIAVAGGNNTRKRLTLYLAAGCVSISLLLPSLSASIEMNELISPNEEDFGSFGCSVSGIPDVDGDGRCDVIVGAYDEDPGASPDGAGRAYVFSGATGVLLWTLVSPNEEELGRFGCSVSGIPDVNGDGRGDVIVGAYSEDPGASPDGAGRAYVFSGATGDWLRTLASPNEEAGGAFGWSVSGIPDIDADGCGDVIVGAYAEDPGASPDGAGRAYVFSGATGDLLWTLVSQNEEEFGRFGHSVSGIPDVDGDGRLDVIVGANCEDPGASPGDAGRAYVFSGATGALLDSLASPNEEAGGVFGWSVSGIPDIDGDNRGDVIVGAKDEDPGASPDNAGRAYVFSGATGDLLWTLVSPNEQEWGAFGFSVSGIPDVDADGHGDVIVGAAMEDSAGTPENPGRAYVFSGATGALLWTLVSPYQEVWGHFGYSVSGIADVDADGHGDVVVGALWEDPGASPTWAGRAYVITDLLPPLFLIPTLSQWGLITLALLLIAAAVIAARRRRAPGV